MKIKLTEDTTLTVKAGQTVEVDDAQADLVIKLGRAVKVETKKKK